MLIMQKCVISFRHEDGTVKFWATGSVSLRYLLAVDTAKEFEGCFLDDADTDRTDGRSKRQFDCVVYLE